ncbi:MAG: c-type cytochrome [Phycisphaerales bacterium]|nr:c-type cytochrome [Phycisphaerales bacterium]
MARTRSTWLAAGVLPVGIVVGALFAPRQDADPIPDPTPEPGGLVERGRYLVEVGACADCHSPHDQTGNVITGAEFTGHPPNAPIATWEPGLLEKGVVATTSPTLTSIAGPWGISIAPNLTPDMETGIGRLTAEALIASWRTGKHWQTGQPIKPPMPWPSYAKFTDEDIRAIHAYLMSLEPKKAQPIPTPPQG